jgi:uncharacterized LabA/DUF88 family protein
MERKNLMNQRARIFVDYWNFQLNWNERANEERCDWLALPWTLVRATERTAKASSLVYEGTHIYASVDPNNENLLNWLETFLERQPGFMVNLARLLRRHRPVRCSACGSESEACPDCGEPFSMSTSKGLTTQMVVDLMALHTNNACEVPIIVSSDTELMPVVQYLTANGVKVIHAGWREAGLDLARQAWASIELDHLIPELIRS